MWQSHIGEVAQPEGLKFFIFNAILQVPHSPFDDF